MNSYELKTFSTKTISLNLVRTQTLTNQIPPNLFFLFTPTPDLQKRKPFPIILLIYDEHRSRGISVKREKYMIHERKPLTSPRALAP